MKIYKFTALLTPIEEDGENYYLVSVPAIPEIVSQGDSIEEATYMAQDAIELVVQSRLEEGESIPKDRKPSRIPKGATVKEILVSIVHNVSSTPLTHDVKVAFA